VAVQSCAKSQLGVCDMRAMALPFGLKHVGTLCILFLSVYTLVINLEEIHHGHGWQTWGQRPG
jgi:hypothetical protein